jgi:hypothetical protein
VSADLPGRVCAVRVQAVFHVSSDQQAQAVAAKMIDGAHEIANLPECECDVDVGVELSRSEDAFGTADPASSLAACRATRP